MTPPINQKSECCDKCKGKSFPNLDHDSWVGGENTFSLPKCRNLFCSCHNPPEVSTTSWEEDVKSKIAGAIQFAMFCKRNNANIDFEKLSYEQANKILEILKKSFISQLLANQKEEIYVTSKPRPEWKEERKNLRAFYDRFPNAITNVIDSAYVAGLDGRKGANEELVKKVEGMRKEPVMCECIGTKHFCKKEDFTSHEEYNQAIDDFIKHIIN